MAVKYPNIQKYSNIFHWKTLQKLHNAGFFGLKIYVPSGNPDLNG
jgi:hypothetical protein